MFFISYSSQYWSANLSAEAQEYADRCTLQHNVNRHSAHQTKYRFVGENIGIGLSRDITQVIDYWASEGASYNYYKKLCQPRNSFTTTCEHYMQVTVSRLQQLQL